jgi:putative intracellular protease/amidase
MAKVANGDRDAAEFDALVLPGGHGPDTAGVLLGPHRASVTRPTARSGGPAAATRCAQLQRWARSHAPAGAT